MDTNCLLYINAPTLMLSLQVWIKLALLQPPRSAGRLLPRFTEASDQGHNQQTLSPRKTSLQPQPPSGRYPPKHSTAPSLLFPWFKSLNVQLSGVSSMQWVDTLFHKPVFYDITFCLLTVYTFERDVISPNYFLTLSPIYVFIFIHLK